MGEERRSYYAIIPANVRYDADLPANAKLLYGEITALCNDRGYCWATNDYFAKLYNVSKTSVSKWISALIKKGYIYSEIIYKEGTKEIDNRYLKIVKDPIEEKLNTPIEEKLKDNNTFINNTINNKKVSKKESKKESFDDLIENFTTDAEVKDLLKEWLKVRKAKRAAMTNRAIELNLNKLNNLANESNMSVKDYLEEVIRKGWAAFYKITNYGGNNNAKFTNSNGIDISKYDDER